MYCEFKIYEPPLKQSAQISIKHYELRIFALFPSGGVQKYWLYIVNWEFLHFFLGEVHKYQL